MNIGEPPLNRLALLIDADNAQPSITEVLLSEVAKYGVANVKRIYGDWTTPSLTGWKIVLLEHSIMNITTSPDNYGIEVCHSNGRSWYDSSAAGYKEKVEGV
jgi:hypothetical protein